ncbi:MAG TPA: hypothetical protein DDY13_16210 [Cytophagales bacterium]|nr:hypothetical protein [Cytophagales bacterium]
MKKKLCGNSASSNLILAPRVYLLKGNLPMKNIWILALLGLIASCNSIETNDLEKQSVENDDYIVFGRFYGYCLGEKCIDIYKFTDQKILEDSRDQYPNYIESYPGSFDQDLTENWYKYAEIHLPEVPVALFQEQDTIVGMPDAADWGGVYFEINQNGEKRYWLLDNNSDNLPEYLVDFKNALHDLSQELP